MGVTIAVVCTRCRVEAPEIGDCGYVGLPRLSPRKRRGVLQTFGYIRRGFAALGLLTAEIEAFHDFLAAHEGHPIKQLADGNEWDLEDDEERDGGRGDGEEDGGEEQQERRPRRTPRFPERFHELACSCGAVQRSSSSDRLRPFEPISLSPADIAAFRANVLELDTDNFHAVGGFPFDDIDVIGDFLRQHARHTITARLTEGETSRTVGRRAKRTAGDATPHACSPQESECFLGPVSRVDALFELHDRDAAVRAAAARAVGAAGECGALGYLVALLEDPDVAVRVAAVGAIGRMDDGRRLRALGHALADESDQVRSSALAALEEAGLSADGARRASRTPQIIRKDPIPTRALGVPQLADSLRHPRYLFRSAALRVLHGTRDRAAVDPLLMALADPAWANRNAAAEALARNPGPRTVTALLRAGRDQSQYVRGRVVEALAKLKAQEAVPLLREMLFESPVSAVSCSTVCEALAAIGNGPAIDVLIEALDHGSGEARVQACFRLGRLKDQRAVPAFLRALACPDPQVRGLAAGALGELRREEAVDGLRALLSAGDDSERNSAVLALSAIATPATVPLLAAALRDRTLYVRRAAARALGTRREPRVRAALLAAARRGDLEVCQEVWSLLVAIGDPSTLQTLERALGYADWDVAMEMASGFLRCGNLHLVRAARRRLDGMKARPGGRTVRWAAERDGE